MRPLRQKACASARIGQAANAERGPVRAFRQEEGLRIGHRLRRAFKPVTDSGDDLEKEPACLGHPFDQVFRHQNVSTIEKLQAQVSSHGLLS